MKILMIAPGSSQHSQRPLNWLLQNEYDVVFMDSVNPYPEGHANYQFIPYPEPRLTRYYKWFGKNTAKWLALWTVALPLRLLWEQIKPDITHVHWVDHRAYHCAKAELRPLVLSVWGTDVNQHFLSDAEPENCWIIGQALAYANRVIAETPFMAERCNLLARQKINTEQLSLGVDTKLFRPGYSEAALEWKQRLNVPVEFKVLLSPRAWTRNYGHHLILEAFALARSRLKNNTVLAFLMFNRRSYGDAMSYEKELRCRAEELGITEWIRWINEVSMAILPEVYAFADVVINFPTMDSLPFTLLEVAACERPVITSRMPSYKGTIAEKYFYTVEPDDVTALADAIVHVLNEDPVQRLDMLSRARRVVEQEYNESIFIKHLSSIYKELAY